MATSQKLTDIFNEKPKKLFEAADFYPLVIDRLANTLSKDEWNLYIKEEQKNAKKREKTLNSLFQSRAAKLFAEDRFLRDEKKRQYITVEFFAFLQKHCDEKWSPSIADKVQEAQAYALEKIYDHRETKYVILRPRTWPVLKV